MPRKRSPRKRKAAPKARRRPGPRLPAKGSDAVKDHDLTPERLARRLIGYGDLEPPGLPELPRTKTGDLIFPPIHTARDLAINFVLHGQRYGPLLEDVGAVNKVEKARAALQVVIHALEGRKTLEPLVRDLRGAEGSLDYLLSWTPKRGRGHPRAHERHEKFLAWFIRAFQALSARMKPGAGSKTPWQDLAALIHYFDLYDCETWRLLKLPTSTRTLFGGPDDDGKALGNAIKERAGRLPPLKQVKARNSPRSAE